MSLVLRDVAVARDNRAIVEAATIAVRSGELVALIGPNGAGKSTLLDVLAGQRAPDAGTATLDGQALADWPRRALACRRALVAQSPVLDFALSVLDVVLTGRSPHRDHADNGLALDIVAEVLVATGLEPLADRAYTALSGGERQRVHVARALAQIWPCAAAGPPGYLLLDEPTNNLDLAHQHRLLALARGLCTQGVGVFAVLHDPNLAAQYADRVAIQQPATALSVGTPWQMLTRERMAQVFGVDADVVVHPRHGCPLVIAAGVSASN